MAVLRRIFILPKKAVLLREFRAYELKIRGKGGTDPSGSRLVGLIRKLFCDTVCENYLIDCWPKKLNGRKPAIVWLKRGVYDAEGEMALYACRKLRLWDCIESIRFGRGIYIAVSSGQPTSHNPQHLYNPLVEEMEIYG
ncbi:MAG: hypothetical protein HY547_05300 [Elusimicrobia bacterium]|nr:hypothetical protein [Elusimicrobiota bacterium]